MLSSWSYLQRAAPAHWVRWVGLARESGENRQNKAAIMKLVLARDAFRGASDRRYYVSFGRYPSTKDDVNVILVDQDATQGMRPPTGGLM